MLVQHGQGDICQQRGQNSALRSAGNRLTVLVILGEDASPQKRLHQMQDPFVPDSIPHPVHQSRMRNFIETCRNIRLKNPLIIPGRSGQIMNLGDRVLRPAPWTETVGTRLEIRLEDRLQHQLQRSLHDPVPSGRDPQPPDLARRLRDRLLPHQLRNKPAALHILAKTGQHVPHRLGVDITRSDSVDTSRPCTLVAPHPTPGNHQEGRVVYQVEHIIETTTRISHRPLVQLGLHRKYPRRRWTQLRPRNTSIHRRSPINARLLRSRWTPSPCGRLSRPRTTTGPPPHPGSISRRRTFPPGNWQLTGFGTTGMVPTFTFRPFDGIGTQLCPCSIAAATPQAFTAASRPATSTGQGVPRNLRMRVRAATQPRSARFELVGHLEGLSVAGSSRMPLRPACRTRTIWQY